MSWLGHNPIISGGHLSIFPFYLASKLLRILQDLFIILCHFSKTSQLVILSSSKIMWISSL